MKLLKLSLLLTTLLIVASCQKQFLSYFQKGQVQKLEKAVEIPFTIENGLIIIPVEIEGDFFRFLLDTGAPNAISKELANKLNIEKSRSFKTEDSQGNRSELDYAKIGKIKIGKAIFTNTTAAIADFNQIDAIACLNIDGLIGANLMRKAYWQIDNQVGVVRIAPSRELLKKEPEEYSIPFITNISGTPLLNLRIGKTEIKRVTLDTGSVGFLSTGNENYKALRDGNQLLAERNAYGASSFGLFGSSKNDTLRQVLINDFSMGDLTLNQQVIELRNSKASLLGMSFLRNYLVTIDWNSTTLYLSPQTNFTNLYAESFGISLFKEKEKLVVAMVTEGSSAQRAGIKVGDIVLQVNDIDVEQTTLDEYCCIIRLVRLKEAETIDLTIERDGKKKEILLTKMPPLSN